jgi:outer membrane protein OmpA-like peptidoglycan-associated protein
LSIARNLILIGAVSSLAACAYSGPRYVPRPHVPLDQYTMKERMEDKSDRVAYNQYEHREPCQYYRRIPRHSVEMINCLVKKAPPMERVTQKQQALLPIIHSYTVYFDFDHDNLRSDQKGVIDQIVREIDTYQPSDITVTGYADRSGTVDYNDDLSKRRAHTVSEALRTRGVVNEEIDQQARGEFDNAVPTADGVKMPENRRVVIDFRR